MWSGHGNAWPRTLDLPLRYARPDTYARLSRPNALGAWSKRVLFGSMLIMSLGVADFVKRNVEERRCVRAWFGEPPHPERTIAAVGETFDCSAVCVTGGEVCAGRRKGAGTTPGYEMDVVESVWGGDAVPAALLVGILRGDEGPTVLKWANRLGAFVAAHSGARSAYSVESLDDISDPTYIPSCATA